MTSRQVPPTDLDRSLDLLLPILTAESLETALAHGLSLLGALTGARAGALLLVEGQSIVGETWYPTVEARNGAEAQRLRALAVESVLSGEALSPDGAAQAAGKDPPRVLLLTFRGRHVGAVCLACPAFEADAGRAPSDRVDRLVRLLADVVGIVHETAASRAARAQYDRWLKQLDGQIRVLDRERQKFAAVVNQTDTYVFVTDTSNTIRWANRTMGDRWRPDGDDSSWIGRACHDLCSHLASGTLDSACRVCPIARALESNQVVHEELKHSSGGRIRTLYMSALPIKGPDGRPHETLVMIQDLSDLETLRENEERYRVVAETASDGIITIDEDSRIMFVNHAIEKIFGYLPGELLGQPLTVLMPERLVERHRAAFKRYLRTGMKHISWEGVQMPGRHKSGREIALEMSFGEYIKGGKHMFTGVMRDITERKRLEAQLRQSQKMDAVGRLAGGVAHDFNNLLTTILGYSSLLLQSRAGHEAPDKRLIEIKKSAERAAGLTRQLLSFSRNQAIEPRVVDLNLIVADMEDMLRRLIGEDIDVVFTPSGIPARVKADPGQIEQVLMNLVVNARDAMPGGGRLTVETSLTEITEPRAPGDTLQAGTYAVLSVRDTGCGMDAETQAHMFEPFFTTKERGKGTGLGLAMVYGIVLQSGGHIQTQSEPGCGSTFSIYLPRVEAGSEVPEMAVDPARPFAGTETVLLVEDEAPVRQLAREMLLGTGYTVVEARSGAEALELFRRRADEIDIVVTDVVMPQMGGGELVEKLMVLRPGVRVLFVSGYTDEALVRHGAAGAAPAFLQKPFTYETFVAKLREVLDSPMPQRADEGERRQAA